MMAAMSQLGETDPASLFAAYFEPGWTDGLPVVPPTEKSVGERWTSASIGWRRRSVPSAGRSRLTACRRHDD